MSASPLAPRPSPLEEGDRLTPRWDAAGLVPCVATHADSGEVLMLAYMNAEALERLADDPALRRRLGQAARQRALTWPTRRESAARFFGALRDVAEGRGARGEGRGA